MTDKTEVRETCESKHKGVMLAMAKWIGIPILGAVVAVNVAFMEAGQGTICDHETRIRSVEATTTAGYAEMRAEFRAIRAQLDRIEKRIDAAQVASIPPSKEMQP